MLLKRVILALIEQIPIRVIIVIVIAILAIAIFYACLLPVITDKRKKQMTIHPRLGALHAVEMISRAAR